MNLMTNCLPTRTWNRLGMNESRVSVEGEFHNHAAQARWDPEQVQWTAKMEAAPCMVGELQELTACADTACARTEEGVKMQSPLVLTYAYQGGEQGASRLVLHAEKNSEMRVLMVLSSAEKAAGAIRIQIDARENARIHLYTVQLMEENSLCLYQIAGTGAECSQVELTKLELGAGKVYAGANMDLKGRESSFRTEIGYHAKAGQVLDMNYVAQHHGKDTNSLMEVNGTLEDGSRKIFRGTIDFQQGCAGAKGTENENVLLLGENMVNQTIPLILCKEEDVEGNHGASIGRLDEKVLFYLGSRGISQAEAQQMIAQSRIEAICQKIPDDAVREQVREFEARRGIACEGEL